VPQRDNGGEAAVPQRDNGGEAAVPQRDNDTLRKSLRQWYILALRHWLSFFWQLY